eukprot:66644-Chlamydomonas_euryale.AAC.2
MSRPELCCDGGLAAESAALDGRSSSLCRLTPADSGLGAFTLLCLVLTAGRVAAVARVRPYPCARCRRRRDCMYERLFARAFCVCARAMCVHPAAARQRVGEEHNKYCQFVGGERGGERLKMPIERLRFENLPPLTRPARPPPPHVFGPPPAKPPGPSPPSSAERRARDFLRKLRAAPASRRYAHSGLAACFVLSAA